LSTFSSRSVEKKSNISISITTTPFIPSAIKTTLVVSAAAAGGGGGDEAVVVFVRRSS